MQKQLLHVGKKIKMLRALKGLSQSDLAEKINKTRSMVSNIEQTGKVNHYTLLAILKTLNITEKELEDFEGKVPLARELSSEMKQIKAENELLKQQAMTDEKEILTLKALVKSQEKIIKMLEKK